MNSALLIIHVHIFLFITCDHVSPMIILLLIDIQSIPFKEMLHRSQKVKKYHLTLQWQQVWRRSAHQYEGVRNVCSLERRHEGQVVLNLLLRCM